MPSASTCRLEVRRLCLDPPASHAGSTSPLERGGQIDEADPQTAIRWFRNFAKGPAVGRKVPEWRCLRGVNQLNGGARSLAHLIWIFGAACAAGTVTDGSSTAGAISTDSDDATGLPDDTTGLPGDTTNSDTTTDQSGDGGSTTCEPTTGGSVCEEIPVTPGGDRGCGGEELQIAGCDQLAGYEMCPNEAIHRHTAGIPCDDLGLCSPLFSCHVDEDCGPNMACVCDLSWDDDRYPGPIGRITSCVPANCRSDEDCAFGMRCALDSECGYVTGLYCHTPEDGCEGDADCPARCSYSSDERWFCAGHVYCE